MSTVACDSCFVKEESSVAMLINRGPKGLLTNANRSFAKPVVPHAGKSLLLDWLVVLDE